MSNWLAGLVVLLHGTFSRGYSYPRCNQRVVAAGKVTQEVTVTAAANSVEIADLQQRVSAMNQTLKMLVEGLIKSNEEFLPFRTTRLT